MDKKKKIIIVMSVVLVLSVVGVIIYKKNKSAAAASADPALGSTPTGSAAGSKSAEVQLFLDEIKRRMWLPEYQDKLKVYFTNLPQSQWDDFYPYWAKYYVPGKDSEAPEGMGYKFQLEVNKAVAAGAWPK